MRNLAITLMVSAFAVSQTLAGSWEKHGDKYEKNSAASKSDLLWKEITANSKPYGWYSAASLAGIFVESMSPSLQFVGDTFEDAFLGPRNKYIHTVGNVGKVKFVPVANNEGYTGIFEGADHGYIRMSLAKQPDYTKTSAKQAYENFVPGFGLKFLRDNVPSANMVAMYSVDGQESWNFFKNDFTNHIAAAQDLGLKVLAKKFATATPFIQYVGLSHWAEYGQDGQKRANPKFPFQLVFEPTLRNAHGDDFEADFQQILGAIPAGTTLYKVMAIQNPGSPKVHIGDLVMETNLVSSYFGDRYMFFKHQDMREDVKIKPEWESHLEVGSSRCPFTLVKNYVKELAKNALQGEFSPLL